MFQAAVRATRPAVAAAAATVAANAAQGTAQARAPPTAQGPARTAPHAASSKIIDRDAEGWLLTELQDEVVMFKPYNEKEVDEAADMVMALWSGHGSSSASVPYVTEPDDELPEHQASSPVSSRSSDDGRLADAVIEGAGPAVRGAAQGGGDRQAEQLDNLMAITTRLLRRPGMQREVVKCMMEDEEVRNLMLRQCSDLDRYLLAAGVTNPQLLTGPETPAQHDAARGSGEAAGPNLVEKLVGVVAGALEKAGEALAHLGGWLRRRLAFLFPVEEGEEGGAGERRTADQLLGGVMVLAVAVFCVALIRKPLVLRALRR